HDPKREPRRDRRAKIRSHRERRRKNPARSPGEITHLRSQKMKRSGEGRIRVLLEKKLPHAFDTGPDRRTAAEKSETDKHDAQAADDCIPPRRRARRPFSPFDEREKRTTEESPG